MARRRWIDPSFWDDENIGDLTFAQRLFFIGCWSNADDEGRLRGNPAFLRSAMFVYDDISLEEVQEIRDAVLSTMGRSLELYVHNDREYLAFDEEHWTRYQNPNHPKPSILPAPPKKANPDERGKDRGPQEGRKNPEGEPTEGRKNGSHVGRVGLGRVGLDRAGTHNRQPFSQIFTEVTDVLVATGVQAEEIDAWMEDVPEGWFRDACKEAVDYNARNWKYVRTILERWRKEGKQKRGSHKRSRVTDDLPYNQIAAKRQAEREAAELDA